MGYTRIDMVYFDAAGFDYTPPHLSEWLSGIPNPDRVVEKTFVLASSYWQGRQSAQFASCR